MERDPRLVQQAKRNRKMPTPAEQRLWDLLRSKCTGYKFRRQHPIGPYIVDFFCSEFRLVIEADGGRHGGADDQNRDQFLKTQDCRILRFWNNDILENTDSVGEKIRLTLHDLAQLPRVTPVRTIFRGEKYA